MRVAAGLLVLLAGIAAVIVVIVRDKSGKEVGRLVVPKDGSLEIKGQEKEQPAPKEGVGIEPEPLAPLAPGEPLAAFTLVAQPARLAGVRSWTIATREAWAISAWAYRPDGKRLAVGGWDSSVRIWEPQTGRLVQVLFTGGAWSLAWSPDGRVLAVGSNGGCQLWEAEVGRLLRTQEMPAAGFLRALGWSPDGGQLFAWGDKGGCIAWDVARGKLLPEVPMKCESAAFSPDGTRLAGIRDGKRVLVWSTATGKEARALTAPAPVWRLAWSPDGKRLACTGQDGLRAWEVETGKETFHRKEALTSLDAPAWSPDGRALAYCLDAERGVALVEAAPGAEPRALEDAGSSAVAWSPDGTTIARINGWPWLRLYGAATGKRLRSLSEGRPIDMVAWSPDGKVLAVSDERGTSLVSADTGQALAELKGSTGPLAWSPDGKRWAAAGPNQAVLLHGPDGKVQSKLDGHQAKVTSLAWSPDGKRLASTAAGEKRVLLWDADKGERDRELGPFLGAAEKVQWSADGRVVAFHVAEVGWHVHDLEQNRLVNDPGQWKAIGFVLAPDGRLALVAPREGDSYRLRELVTGKERGQLPQPQHVFMSPPTWSADGRLLAVADYGGTVLWRPDLRKRVRALDGRWHGRQLAFSQSGQLVAVLAGDRLQIWETDTGRVRGVLMLGPAYNGLTVTSDGHYTGNDQVERGIVVVVQKDDGTQELLEPAGFEKKYGWKNDPNKVHLLQPLPPSAIPLAGQPMGPLALVREPAELADANVTGWTIETVSSRARINGLAYRPDGTLLATGGADGTIRLWDTASGELVRMLVGDAVQSLSWSPDGKVLASGGGTPPAACLWEAETGRLLRRLPDGVHVAWSPDGRTLALLSYALGRLQLWDAATERVVRSDNLSAAGMALAWSPDSKTLAVALFDKTVRLLDAVSGKETYKLEGHESFSIHGLAWSPDGKRLVTAAVDEAAFRVWDAGTGKLLGRYPAPVAGAKFAGPAAAWAPDGKTVAIGSAGLFDPETGRPARPLEGVAWVSALAWSPDGRQLASADIHGVRIHQTDTGKRTHTLDTRSGRLFIASLAWSPDGKQLALGSNAYRPLILDAATGRHLPLPRVMGRLAWSPDGKLLAALRSDSVLQLWDAATTETVRPLEQADEALWPDGLAWTADSTMLAAGGRQQLRVWSAPTGKLLWQNDKHQQAAGVAWSPDGRRLATTDAGDKGAVRLWDAETGRLLHEVPLRSGTLAWSPDGKMLAAGALLEGPCLLIDTATGAPGVKIRGEFSSLKGLRWSPDARTLFTLDNGGSLRTWDAATGEQRQAVSLSALPDGPGWVSAAWTPDGRVLARSNMFEVRLSDDRGRLLGVLLPGDPFEQLAVAPDGHYRGTARVERQVRMVVQKRDGTSETLTPADFAQKYGFPNDGDKVHLLRPLPP